MQKHKLEAFARGREYQCRVEGWRGNLEHFICIMGQLQQQKRRKGELNRQKRNLNRSDYK